MMLSTANFSAPVAERYDGYRALPAEILEAIHRRIVAAIGLDAEARLVELGAGTGRFGRLFSGRGYHYLGLDSSPDMLQRFRRFADPATPPDLAIAGVTDLPLANESADLVVVVQALGVVPAWRSAVAEALRVTRLGGWIVTGRVEHRPDSLHALVRGERNRLLAGWGLTTERPGASEAAIQAAFAAAASDQCSPEPVCWQVATTPAAAIEASLSGWRIQALPNSMRAELGRRLRDAVASECAGLDELCHEQMTFVLHGFRRH